MTRSFLTMLVAVFVGFNANAQNSGLWYFSYREGNQAGQISSCNASFDYSNAFFSARFAGESLDFVYFRDDFTLPFGQVLGRVIFSIDQVAFEVSASTNERVQDSPHDTSQILFLTPLQEDVVDLVVALRLGREFRIVFPNNATYSFPLSGSDRAFRQAIQCWVDRPTGPYSNNPFTPSTTNNNPFEEL